MKNENIHVDNQICLHIPSIAYASKLYRVIDFNRKILSEFLPWPNFVKHENDTTNYLNSCLLAHKEDKEKHYIILFNQSVVGLISFNTIDHKIKVTDIGYWLDSRFEGKGIMTRSVNALTEYYSSNRMIKRFIIKCAVNNIKSNQVAKRCGFIYEETRKQAEYVNDVFYDQNIYSFSS